MNRLGLIVLCGALSSCLTACSVGTVIIDFSKYPAPQVSDTTNGITLEVGRIKDTRGFDDPTEIRFNTFFDRPVADAVREALIMELKGAGYSIGESDVRVNGNLTIFGQEPGTDRCSLSVTVTKGTPGKRIFSKTYQYQNTINFIWEAHRLMLDRLKQCVVQFTNDNQFLKGLQGEVDQNNDKRIELREM